MLRIGLGSSKGAWVVCTAFGSHFRMGRRSNEQIIITHSAQPSFLSLANIWILWNVRQKPWYRKEYTEQSALWVQHVFIHVLNSTCTYSQAVPMARPYLLEVSWQARPPQDGTVPYKSGGGTVPPLPWLASVEIDRPWGTRLGKLCPVFHGWPPREGSYLIHEWSKFSNLTLM